MQEKCKHPYKYKYYFLSFQKKERNISDEIQAMQGGTIASRYERFEPRKKAIEEREKAKEKLQEELMKQYENYRKEEYNKKIQWFNWHYPFYL